MVKVIAEVANAHQGDISQLQELIAASAESKADGIKFQWFKYDHLATSDYQWYSAYQDLFIKEECWLDAVEQAKGLGLEVWIDLFDTWGLSLLKKHSKLINGIKIQSTITQSPLILSELQNVDKPILLGVGGLYEQEISKILGRLNTCNITLLHGFQGYPTSIDDASLARISYLQNRFTIPVGFADHTDGNDPLGIELPIYAYFAGASVIEKHITMDRSKKGYDYYSSLEPSKFALMVTKLREAQKIMGDTEVLESERNYLKDTVQVVAAKPITQGEIITVDKLDYKRCSQANALKYSELSSDIPAIARNGIEKDQAITFDQIKHPKVVIAVICRLKSTRLKEKALRTINGIPSIERCLLNCLAIPNIDQVVLATSDLPQDDPLEKVTLNGRVKVIRGDPDNIVLRLLQVREMTGASIIVRVTGDNPAVSPEIMEYLIKEHLSTGSDCTLPTENHAIGSAGDVYTVQALKRLKEYLKDNPDTIYTEYLSFYFANNPHLFSINKVELPHEFRFPNWRLTLDEMFDLDMFEALYKKVDLGREPLHFAQIRSCFASYPEIIKMNETVGLQFRDNKKLIEEINNATRLS